VALVPPVLIDPPAPPPRPYGIFDVALGPMPFPGSVPGGGVQYVPDVCEDNVYIIPVDCPPITGTKTFDESTPSVSGSPFVVMTSYICPPIGFNFAEAKRRVLTRLALREQTAVEQRLWSGTSGALGTITGLFRNATNLGTAGCPVEAMELLEQALADNDVPGGIIHARPGMSAHLTNNYLIHYQSVGRNLSTVIRTPLSFGRGYDGSGPTGQAPDATTEWMYASGRVLIWQDPEVWVPPPEQVLNKSTNQLTLVAERMYAVAVECGVWAVQVTRSCTTAGGGT
jgi:hypothetical protein